MSARMNMTKNIDPGKNSLCKDMEVSFYVGDSLPLNSKIPINPICYTVLNSGREISILFPVIPFILSIDIYTKNSGDGKIFLNTAEGSALIDELPKELMDSMFNERGVLLVGINTLSRPVFEIQIVNTESQMN